MSIVIFIIVVFLVGLGVLIFTGLKLPSNTEEIIAEVIEKGPRDQYLKETGFAMHGDIKLFYDSSGKPEKETVLLVHGHSAPLIYWPLEFVRAIETAGYNVVRFDHRGLGKSDWIKSWSRSDAYRLEDMAGDAIAILDHLKIDKAHLMGCSMGGMISQRIALNYPDRVLSLSSLMSSGHFFDRNLTQVTPWLVLGFARSILRWASFKNERKFIKMNLGIRAVLHGRPESFEDVKEGAEESLYLLRHRGGLNMSTRKQHSTAIKKSGSRLAELGQLAVPTTVIHGTNDPLILPEHAEKYAPLIPGVKMVWIKGMGHIITKRHTPEIVGALVENCKRATAKVNESPDEVLS